MDHCCFNYHANLTVVGRPNAELLGTQGYLSCLLPACFVHQGTDIASSTKL